MPSQSKALADTTALTGVEATNLHDLEGVIEKGLAGFVEVGRALERIRDKRLYREKFASFEEYLKERWGLSRAHAYRQIEASAVVGALSPTGDTLAPVSERVARELAPLKDAPEQLHKTWGEVVELHGPKPTAKQVREVVAEHEDHRAEDHGDDDGEQTARPLSKARKNLILGWTGRLDGTAMFCEAFTDDAIADLERIPLFDMGEFVASLRAGQRDLGRLIRRIEERSELEARATKAAKRKPKRQLNAYRHPDSEGGKAAEKAEKILLQAVDRAETPEGSIFLTKARAIIRERNLVVEVGVNPQ